MRGTSNADQPFEPGEVILWCDQLYLVRRNFGADGEVVECDAWGNPTGDVIGKFSWEFDSAIARRASGGDRRLADGRFVPETPGLVPLTINTRAPEKWVFVDTETTDCWVSREHGGFAPAGREELLALQLAVQAALNRLANRG